ncbi:bifunctional phosphopantothenoylcysteine decarboxylase/phosphopantothenate--cysteine ligase CoaBC [Phaeospirillum tilakii]|uniref:Coenzyme A biosynthesis bifunctional protein CoaBC n=1 Tax=Phaeospirillum tilakii TaxID=741673 RepID=A0ABW5C724_9PROT
MLDGRRILLILSGGIAAYKSLDLVRRLKERGAQVRCVLTRAAAEFVTPLSLATLSGEAVHQEMFGHAADPGGIDHIRLTREADLVVVAPATAHLLARMAVGLADDLATTLLLASDKKVLVAPAMNSRMWDHPATQANLAVLAARGVERVGPAAGTLACGETGEGRMAEIETIVARIEALLGAGPLSGRHAIVTSGPTIEPIDPVRYIANRSTGRQGHAIAAALAELGARVTLVSGPVALADPPGCTVVRVESALQMLNEARAALPADIAVCAAAVADWTVVNRSTEKRKKKIGEPPPVLQLAPNPDILATLARAEADRPRLVIGFAAETEALLDNARDKRQRKGCDWILANSVAEGDDSSFGGADNTVHLLDGESVESWPRMSKREVGRRLAQRIAAALAE